MTRWRCRKTGGHRWVDRYDFFRPFQGCSRCGALAWRYHKEAEMPSFGKEANDD